MKRLVLSLMTLMTVAPLAVPARAAATKTHPASVRYFVDPDGPKAKLANGQEFRLIPIRNSEFGIRNGDGGGSEFQIPKSELPIPTVVDHRQFYGPLRHQGERGTCASFASLAAVEGMYRRMDPVRFRDLDLSEQWANHIQKMVDRGRTEDAAGMETALGSWSGAWINYLMLTLRRYGITDEPTLQYNASEAYEKIGGHLMDQDGNAREDARQIEADDFNLDSYRLPVTALEHARYRPTGFLPVRPEQVRDPAYLESLLAQGQDVVFAMMLVEDDRRTEDGAWIPGDSREIKGGHAMLLVGYNHEKQYFIVRNSWGKDEDAMKAGDPDGYARISYDYLRRYGYHWAVAVTAVADPAQEQLPEQLFIRRWTLKSGGKLDIYRLPHTYSYRDTRATDDRIGTYFAPDGKAYRLNGKREGDALRFVIDRENPNLAPDAWSGEEWLMTLTADRQSIQIRKA